MKQGAPKADFVQEAERILQEAAGRDITLRLLGALAFNICCPKYRYLFGLLKREFTDIDFVGYGEQGTKVAALFKNLGYEFALGTTTALIGGRFFFFDKIHKRTVDVFFDKLDMCHTIDLRRRLEIDYPTLSLSDLLLEKLQVVKINEKDLKDVIVLLREHDVGLTDKGTINSEYISRLLSNDWGFYYTLKMNMGKVKEFASKCEILIEEDKLGVGAQVDKLLCAIEKRPKSLKWRIRAKINTRRIWYNEVEEVNRG